eukprot:2276351-Alexandrium_andersonii.AAC.1
MGAAGFIFKFADMYQARAVGGGDAPPNAGGGAGAGTGAGTTQTGRSTSSRALLPKPKHLLK